MEAVERDGDGAAPDCGHVLQVTGQYCSATAFVCVFMQPFPNMGKVGKAAQFVT